MAQRPVFTWQGTDRRGNAVRGDIAAASPRLVRTRLQRQGIKPGTVRRKRAPREFGLFGQRVKSADVALFSRQMATMMRAGVPLVRCFDIVASGTTKVRFAKVIRGIRDEVASGASLASALAGFPHQFDDMYRNLVGVGEQSGTLDAMLDRIATYTETAEATKRKVKKAMTYPLLVVVAAVIVTAILLIHVVPQFEAVFAGVGADLPAFTRLVIRISDFLQSWWLALLIGGIGMGGGAALGRRSPRWRDAVDRGLLRTPIAGGILRKAAVARYARTLATATAAGVPLVDALGSVAKSTGNAVYTRAVLAVRDEAAAGLALHAAMRESRVFPEIAVQMVAVGEESGSLDDMLGRAAEHFEAAVDAAVDNLTTLIEPLMMAVLGVLVGGLILAMYLPVFHLGSVFGG